MASTSDIGILIVDDEAPYRRSLSIMLERKAGFTQLYQCEDALKVMDFLDQNPIGVVLLDLNMPGKSGRELLVEISEKYPEISVVIISGLNQVETAMDCLRLGAFDFFVKTTEEERLLEGIKRAVQMQEMQQENLELADRVLNRELNHPEAFEDILSQSATMASVFQYLESIAKSTQPLLISGESGTGKELIAQAVHKVSGREGRIVTVNVAGLDENIFNDTLFGHKKGAFTGANSDRLGLVEEAAGGTLFLDEIGDLSPGLQVKLLRLLQEGEFYPIGADRPKRMQTRVIVATHQNLAKLQDQGKFRKDLFYRLRIHQVQIPALRHRREDIRLLFSYFAEQAAREMGKPEPEYDAKIWTLLHSYDFPGNVRELRSIAFDAVGRQLGSAMKAVDLELIEQRAEANVEFSEEPLVQFTDEGRLPTLSEMDEILLSEAMRRAQGNQSIAARILGISQPAISKRLKRFRDRLKPGS